MLKQAARIDFVKHVQPILEENCVSCHNPEKTKGKWDLSTKAKAFESGENAPNIVAFNPPRAPSSPAPRSRPMTKTSCPR